MSRSKELEVKRLSEMLALLEKTADLILKTTPSREKKNRTKGDIEQNAKASSQENIISNEISLEGSLR